MSHQFEQRHEAEVPANRDEVWAAIATGPGIDSWFMGRNEVQPGALDGRFIAYEFLIEGRAGGSTVLRTVTSGFIPGDDWADEFEAMTLGGEMYFRTLVEYLSYFAGRFATPVTAFGPPDTDWARELTSLGRGHGDRGPPPFRPRRRTRASPAGLGILAR
jgi:hypothetical protein